MNKPMIIGHRGAAGVAPENTLASFQLALAQGADGVELDVHLSRDGRLMVCHDPTLDRTTNGSGWICRMKASEIRQYDAGVGFDERFRGETVPTLDEVFDLMPPGILINIEIKSSYNGLMEEALGAFLRERERMEDVVVSSFDHKCLQRLKRSLPGVRIGLLYAANLVHHSEYARLLEVHVHSLHPHYHLLDQVDVAAANERGIATYPYTANLEEDLRTLIGYGVTGIITDYPARLKALLSAAKEETLIESPFH